MFLGVTIPSDSFVDLDDVLDIQSSGSDIPSNTNPNDRALQCVTDLVDCCDTPRMVHGDWYFQGGNRIVFGGNNGFQANRAANEVINNRQFNGSVRLWRRLSNTLGRGRFRCELPNAANPSVNQTLYVNICEFITQL